MDKSQTYIAITNNPNINNSLDMGKVLCSTCGLKDNQLIDWTQYVIYNQITIQQYMFHCPICKMFTGLIFNLHSKK